jgi:hypothetical protein
MLTWRWIISHRCSWITVYVSCRNAQLNLIVVILSYIYIVMRSLFYQLPSCNLFTQYVSYLLWRDTTSELWTPVHSFTLIKPPTAITNTERHIENGPKTPSATEKGSVSPTP